MKKLCILLTTILILTIVSCEIGLGSSVDTDAPALEITTPPADAVIRQAFNIGGTWSDDGSISSVSIKMVRLDNGSERKFSGSVNSSDRGKGTWNIVIDPTESGLADGTYEALVSINDNGGHTTSMARSFTIDNTPPVLILTKPTSTLSASGEEETTLSVYGKSLFLEGSIADTTKETWIEMKFYSDPSCAEEYYLDTIETDSIAPTNVNQNNTKYAEYDSETVGGIEILKDNTYSNIYIRSDNIEKIKKGAIPVYATLTVYDTAETYSLSQNSDKNEVIKSEKSKLKNHVRGNSTETFYISADLAKDITKSKSTGGKGLAPIDIYNILNGSQSVKDKARSTEEGETLTKEALENALKPKGKTKSVFSVNPDNNPYFTVSGLKTLTGSGQDFASADNGYYIKNGSLTLEISVFMGSDSFELEANDPDFYAYLLECDSYGNPLKEDIEANRLKLYSKFKETGTGKDKKMLYKIGGKEGHKTTNGAYVFSVPMNKTLNTNTDSGIIEYDKLAGLKLAYGHNYLIRVNGKDVEGNKIDNESNKYGFRFTSSGAAPEITITEPAKNYVSLKKGDDLRIEGTVKTEEPDVILSILMGSESEPVTNVELEPTENLSVYSFAYTLKHTDGGKVYFSQDESKEYSVLVTATGEAKASSSIFVSYDVDPPVITKNSEQPLVQLTKPDGSVLNCINGTFTLSGIITDNDIFGSATYKVSQNNICKISDTYIPGKFIIPINTRNLEDETPVTIEINAKDRSGNPAKEVFEYFVSQKTDKPDISNGAENVNLDADYATIAVPYNVATKDFYNMFQRKTNLYLNIQDDDGLVKKVTVDLQKFKSNGNSIEPDKDENGNDIKAETAVYESRDVIQYPLPDEEGIYFAVVKAYDINYDFTHPAENDANYNFSKKAFFLKVTGNGPDVTLKPDRDFISTANENGADLNIEFTVADVGNGPYTVYMNDGSGNRPLFDGAEKTSPFDVSLHFNKDVTSCADIKFTVKDKNNVGTEKKFSPKFDNEKPNIDFAESGWPVKPERTEDETFFFKGVIDDNEAAGKEVAGVDKVQIRFVTGDFDSAVDAIAAAEAEASPAVSTNWIDATVAGKAWNYEATWQSDELKNVFATENTKTVIVNAIDGAGNSKMASRTFVFDKMIPEVFEVTGADYKNGNSVELTIKYRDTNPDGASLKILDISGHVPTPDAYTEGTNPIIIEELSSVEDSETGKTIKTIKATVVFPKTKRTGENGTEISYLLEDGTYEIQIIAKDLNNRESKTYKYQVTRDTCKPELDNIAVATTSKVNRVHNPEKGKYFVNNNNQAFTISGLAKDNIGVENIKLEIFRITKSEATAEPVADSTALITKTASAQIWSFNNIDFSGSDWIEEKTIGAKATITVTDKAGNSTQEDLTITFDTTPPVSIHEIDDKFKDLYFRIGNANNDDITKTNASKYGLTWTPAKDEGVGNKYSTGAYGNDLTIQIRGNFDDGENGSGVKKIYYQVKDSETLISDLRTKEEYAGKTEEEVLVLFAKEIAENTSDTKSFSPLESPETKRVFYNSRVTTDQTSGETSYDGTVGGRIKGTVNQLTQQANAETGTPEKPTAKFYKDVVTTYKNSITGFKEGSNYVILVVEDNVGNLSLDVARDVPYKDEQGQAQTGNFINYSLNVDTAVPVITSDDNTDTLYTNQSGYVELSGTVNDTGAGLGSLKFNLNNTELEVYNTEEGDEIPDDLTQIKKCLVTITTTQSGTNGEKRENTWNIKIPSSKFSDSDTTYTVYAIAKDKAGTGNETKESVGTIKVDKTAPAITIASPKANTPVNKEIVFSGSISDGTNSAGIDTSAEKAPKLYWTTKSEAITADPNPKALAANAKAGWVELALSTAEEAPSALIAKTWNTDKHEWTFTVDTEKLKADGSSVVPNGTTAYFTISASDKAGSGDTAGNTGYAPVHALIIDQNSDRPIIKFSNLDISSMTNNSRVWITKEELYASVTDDDGEVESVKISFDGTNESSWSDQDAQGNKYYTKENGLSITLPSDKDGEQQIWFKVTDAKGTTFTSSTTTDAAVTTAPKLAYKNVEFGATPARYYSMLYAKIDLGDPAIPLVYYTTVNDDSTPVENAAGLANLLSVNNSDELTESAKENWHDLTGVKTVIGGPAKAIYIFVKAKDANGISQITPTFTTSVTLNDNEKPVITTPITDTVDNEKSSIALIKIDISKCTGTNDYKLELRSTDNANRSISRSFDMSIDKESPVVYIDSPAENAELYGTAGLPNSNVTVRGRSDADVSKIYMAVTKGGAEEPDSLEEGNYIDITKSNGISWSVIFNGNKGGVSTTDFYEDRFNTWIDTLWGSGTSEDPSISEKEICLWFYAEDKLGNKGIKSPKKLPIKIFTQGDRPTVAITSPDQGGQVGGIITVTGSTSIAIKSVENIWLQIDSNYNGSSFNENWETALTGSGGLLEGKIPEQLGYTIEDSGNTTIGRAIKAGGSKTSWNLAINKASEFNKADNSNRTMAIRAYAISTTGKPSNPVIVSFTLDPNAPVFGQLEGQALRLVQYANNETGEGAEIASRLYESGIDLKGKWWLTGSVSDDSGIVSLQKVTKEVTENVLTNCTTTGAADAETHCYNYIMKIPLSGEGKLETKLRAQEGAKTNKASEFPIVLNFDNAEPLFECTSLSETEAKQIYQSDGVYEIRGTFNDNSGSDFKRIAFYVTRTIGQTNYLTDVMIKQGENLTDNSYVLSTLQHTNNDNKDLYWQTITECKIQNGTEILIKKTQQNLPNYIRRGAVCRINNILYRINKIELNTDITNNSTYPIKLVVDTKINDAESISVDFALAQIIDNTVKEQGKTNTYDTSYDIGVNSNQEKFDNDDNDQMVERYSETSGEWTVSIDSNNIKDGAITIHFVAYDKAGNITYKSYNGVVANNVPRFAGVKFGTDVNGDGKVEGDEIKNTYTGWYNIDPENKNKKDGITENGCAANGEKITLWAIPGKTNNITEMDDNADPVMTIKGTLKVIPEIVGGNDGLGWNYKINNGNYIYNKYKEMTGAGHSGSTDIRPTNLTTFEIPDYELISKTSDGINIFTFTISDKTGGTIGGDSASKANLLIKFNVALKDNKAPAAGIKPFYWKSSGKGNNSLYYENNSSVPQGHIELPKDLLGRFAYKAEGNIRTGLNDIDPKVSGKIYLEGFAQDNVVVEKLLLRAYKAGQSAGDFVEVAARNRTAPTEQNPNPNYGNFEYVSAAAAQGFIGFEITGEKTVTKDGNDYNRIEWKVAIDTSILTGNVADTDIIIEVQAKDRGPASASGQNVTYGAAQQSGASTLQTGLKQNAEGTDIALTADTPTFDDSVQTSYYKVDIVPYVTTIETALSFGLKSSIKDAYSRTALGHYIARVGEKILINGFNLAGGTVTFIKNDTETCSADYDISGISIPTDAKSGKMSVTVNGVETLNNINDNNACGAYKTETTSITEGSSYADKSAYAYNRLPNRTSNNLLTDDLVIDIWQLDSDAAKPMSGELREPSMKINPVTGQVGLAFVSGPADIAMADTTNELSYSRWQNNYATFNNISFTYDALGNAHATATGLDTNPKDKHAGRFSYFYSKWGQSGLDSTGNYTGTNALRLESISVPYIKGTTTKRTLSNNDIYVSAN